MKWARKIVEMKDGRIKLREIYVYGSNPSTNVERKKTQKGTPKRRNKAQF